MTVVEGVMIFGDDFGGDSGGVFGRGTMTRVRGGVLGVWGGRDGRVWWGVWWGFWFGSG